jgi:hypothetical protein
MQNILLIISVLVTLISLSLLVYKTSNQMEGFDLAKRHYYPYLYGMTTNKKGQVYTDKGLTYMQRYKACLKNPDRWQCKLMFQEGL